MLVDAKHLKSLSDVFPRVVEREEQAAISLLHGLNEDFEAEQRLAMAGPCANQNQITRL
ncbi:hypothetical protein D9M72_614150 [compost metagenome]